MRILVTAFGIAPSMGGGRTGPLNICRGLKRLGHEVTLYATNVDGNGTLDVPLGGPSLQEGVEVWFFRAQKTFLGNVLSIPMMMALKHKVRQTDLVLIHSLYQFTSTCAAHYCRKFGVPYVLRPHGTLDPFLVYRRRRFWKWAYINLFEKRNFNSAAAIQYSSRMEEDMTREFMAVRSPSLVIPEGVDLDQFAVLPPRGTFRGRYPETMGKTVVLFLGRFHQKKGIELLIEAFARIRNQNPGAHLVLAGSGDSEYLKRISEILMTSGLPGCATITGQLSEQEKHAVLADADLFVLPSYGENFGIAVVEAMACGLPVVISDKVGICREIEDGGGGLVVPCDPDQIASAMEKLVRDSGMRAALGERGRRLARDRFSVERMAKTMEQAYFSLCRKSGYSNQSAL